MGKRTALFKYSRLSSEEWAYIAGIVDGEGCISLRKKGPKLRTFGWSVSVDNTNPLLIRWFSDRLGGSLNIREFSNPSWRTQYQWKITDKKNVVWFLEHLLPYLVIKKQQAKIMIDSLYLLNRAPRNHKGGMIAGSTLNIIKDNSELISNLNHGGSIDYDSTKLTEDDFFAGQ